MTRHSKRSVRTVALIGSLLAAGIALSGCSAVTDLFGGGAQRDENNQITEEANIDVFSLEVGDCMSSADLTGTITAVDVLPCTQPHAAEVFFEFDLEGTVFPDEDTILAAVEAQCVPAFAEFVGTEYFESTLDLRWILPTEETWDQADDRLVQCFILQPDESGEGAVEVTGSLEDSGL